MGCESQPGGKPEKSSCISVVVSPGEPEAATGCVSPTAHGFVCVCASGVRTSCAMAAPATAVVFFRKDLRFMRAPRKLGSIVENSHATKSGSLTGRFRKSQRLGTHGDWGKSFGTAIVVRRDYTTQAAWPRSRAQSSGLHHHVRCRP